MNNTDYRGMHNGRITSANLRKTRGERITHAQRKQRKVEYTISICRKS